MYLMYNDLRLVRLPISGGISPVRKPTIRGVILPGGLALRCKYSSLDKVVYSIGMPPENRFPPNTNSLRFDSWAYSGGSAPVRRLRPKRKYVSWDRLVSSVGKAPVNLLSDAFKSQSLDRLIIV